MSLFKTLKGESPDGSIAAMPIDLSKRYDIYCWHSSEDRLYENVSITCIRTLEPRSQFPLSTVNGFVEIEAQNRTRIMIPRHHIHMICEHGLQPDYKVLRNWAAKEE